MAPIFDQAEYTSWRSFRDSEDSRYVGLTFPRFLLRLPYGQDTVPVKSFHFEEEAGGEDGSSRRQKKKKEAEPDTDEETLDPETRRRRALDRALDEAMKKPAKRRARKQDGIVRDQTMTTLCSYSH